MTAFVLGTAIVVLIGFPLRDVRSLAAAEGQTRNDTATMSPGEETTR
jgi:hypothetical protein